MVLGLSASRISQFDENRQILFYCGLFSSITGSFWLIMGLIMKYAFPKPVGASVNSVAYGIMFVGILVLIIGIVFTAAIFISGTIKSNASVSSSSSSSTTASESSSPNKSSDPIISVAVVN